MAAKYLERDARPLDDEGAARRAAAGISVSDDKFVYRLGPRARGVVGVPALLHYVCSVVGVPEPSGNALRAAHPPEAAGVEAAAPQQQPRGGSKAAAAAAKRKADTDEDGDEAGAGSSPAPAKKKRK